MGESSMTIASYMQLYDREMSSLDNDSTDTCTSGKTTEGEQLQNDCEARSNLTASLQHKRQYTAQAASGIPGPQTNMIGNDGEIVEHKCLFCSTSYFLINNLRYHYKVKHGIVDVICAMCGGNVEICYIKDHMCGEQGPIPALYNQSINLYNDKKLEPVLFKCNNCAQHISKDILKIHYDFCKKKSKNEGNNIECEDSMLDSAPMISFLVSRKKETPQGERKISLNDKNTHTSVFFLCNNCDHQFPEYYFPLHKAHCPQKTKRKHNNRAQTNNQQDLNKQINGNRPEQKSQQRNISEPKIHRYRNKQKFHLDQQNNPKKTQVDGNGHKQTSQAYPQEKRNKNKIYGYKNEQKKSQCRHCLKWIVTNGLGSHQRSCKKWESIRLYHQRMAQLTNQNHTDLAQNKKETVNCLCQ